MEPVSGVVVAVAAFHQHVMANLPAQPVAVIVARGEVAQGHANAVLQPDAAGIIAVQVGVIGLVAVQREIFNRDVGNVLAAEEWEQSLHRGFAGQKGIRPAARGQA